MPEQEPGIFIPKDDAIKYAELCEKIWQLYGNSMNAFHSYPVRELGRLLSKAKEL